MGSKSDLSGQLAEVLNRPSLPEENPHEGWVAGTIVSVVDLGERDRQATEASEQKRSRPAESRREPTESRREPATTAQTNPSRGS